VREFVEDAVSAVRRIVASKKVLLQLVVAAANAAAVYGFEVPVEQLTEGIGLLLNVAAQGVVLGQWALDLRWGSPSDGTGPPVKESADPADEDPDDFTLDPEED